MAITNFFRELAGIPVHYARPPLAPYGTKGVEYKFFIEKDFEQKLHNSFTELFVRADLEDPQVITSAGAYVNKSGYHGLGRAFDLDGIFWKDKIFIANNYPADSHFYLGVEAVLRKHFGTVLNYNYNVAHHDHLHIDEGGVIGFNSASRSATLFVQDALSKLLDIPTAVDGVYGSQTERNIKQGLEQLNITGLITTAQVWLDFLTHLADLAFAKEREKINLKRSPSELLANLLDLVDLHLQTHPKKKDIESAINVFANHPDIKKGWEVS